MKVMVGYFTTESNANIPMKNDINKYDIAFGQECIDKSQVKHIFEKNGFEMIPSIYANAGSSGVIKKETFDYILNGFTSAARKHINEIDGIWLMLHGASYVDGGVGSGDLAIVRELRKIVGPYLPIAVVCDPHGNMDKEYVESTQIFRSYRESPHTDAAVSKEIVAQMLCDLLKDRQNIHACYRKLPLILGGEQSVSADEPVKSINVFMDEMEKDERIRSASWHVGYIRHDSEVAGCGVVVVPQNTEDQEYADQKCQELADYVWERRREFHYTGLTAKPDEALKMTLEFEGSPCVITDSGDNATSGATSWNTYVLRQVLEVKDLKKSFLFATINDPKTFEQLKDLPKGTVTNISLGVGHDYMSTPVELTVKTDVQGEVVYPAGYGAQRVVKHMGNCILVHIVDTKIDVIVANAPTSFMYEISFEYANVNWLDYDVTVLKQGYIFTDFKNKAKFYVMSLTDGATPQDTASLKFKKIMRPMYPIDNI